MRILCRVGPQHMPNPAPRVLSLLEPRGEASGGAAARESAAAAVSSDHAPHGSNDRPTAEDAAMRLHGFTTDAVAEFRSIGGDLWDTDGGGPEVAGHGRED